MMLNEKQSREKYTKYPKPIYEWDSQAKLFLLAIPWGNPDAAKLAIKSIKDYYSTARVDKESTTPFPMQPHLSIYLNHLKIGMNLANENIYQEYNTAEWTAGCEVLALAIQENELSLCAVGGPSLLVKKSESKESFYHFSSHMGEQLKEDALSPLPNQLLGVHKSFSNKTESFFYEPTDKLYFFLEDRQKKDYQADSLLENLESRAKAFWYLEFQA